MTQERAYEILGSSLPHVPEYRGCGDYDNSHYVSPSLGFLWAHNMRLRVLLVRSIHAKQMVLMN